LIKVLKGESTTLKLKKIEKEYGSLKIFDLTQNETFEILLNTLKNKSIFQDKIIIFIKNLDSLKKTQKGKLLKLLSTMKNSDEFEIFIDSESSIKVFETVDLSLPKPWKTEEWLKLIQEISLGSSLNLNNEALELILEKTGPNYDRIYQEVKKLSIYSLDKDPQLGEIENLVHDYNNLVLDDLMFAISSGDMEALNIILSSIFKSFDHQLVLYSLVEHFINLFKVLCTVDDSKESHSWKDIMELSKKIALSTSKIARFLGFNFKSQKTKNINHLKLYNLEKLSVTLEKVIDIQREFRSVESSEVVLRNRLIELTKMVYN